jgi:hypothetical protein
MYSDFPIKLALTGHHEEEERTHLEGKPGLDVVGQFISNGLVKLYD